MAKNNNGRPYINLLTKDFGPEVEKNSSNPDELRKLKIEIGHRKKAKDKLLPLIEVIDGHLASCLTSLVDPEPAPKKITAKSKPRVRVRIGETSTDKTFVEDVASETKPVALGQMGTIRPPSNLLKRLPPAWLPEKKETKIKGLDEASTTPHEFSCALAYLIWEIRNSGSASKTLLLNGGRKEPSFSGEYGSLYAFRYDGDEDVFEGARIEVRIGNKKTGGSISSL